MRALRCEAHLRFDVEAMTIWAYRLDFAHLSAYNPDVSGVARLALGGSDGAGARYRFDLSTPIGTHAVELLVTESRPGSLVAVEIAGPLAARERFAVSGDRPCRVAIELTLEVPDEVPADLDEQLLSTGKDQIAGELARMKEILERTARGGP